MEILSTLCIEVNQLCHVAVFVIGHLVAALQGFVCLQTVLDINAGLGIVAVCIVFVLVEIKRLVIVIEIECLL